MLSEYITLNKENKDLRTKYRPNYEEENENYIKVNT